MKICQIFFFFFLANMAAWSFIFIFGWTAWQCPKKILDVDEFVSSSEQI